MLGDIQKAGGISSLKKVDKNQIRDRSGVQVAGGDSGGGSSAPPAAAPGGGGGMADALAAALQKRKEKVSKSGEFSQVISLCFRIVLIKLLQMTKMMTMSGKRLRDEEDRGRGMESWDWVWGPFSRVPIMESSIYGWRRQWGRLVAPFFFHAGVSDLQSHVA